MQKRTSLKDIAVKVGVSTALVSLLINGKGNGEGIRVRDEVANKIRQTAEDLGYQPNEIARSLKKGATKTLGLIVADISNPFFGYLAKCIENEAVKTLMDYLSNTKSPKISQVILESKLIIRSSSG